MTDNSRAFVGYDQWKTTDPSLDDWDGDSPEGACKNELELWNAMPIQPVETIQQAREMLRYKARAGTQCGCWVEFADDHITIGCSIEGTDFEPEPIELSWPICAGQFDDALDNIEAEAQHIWMQTHGCPCCYDGKETVNTYEWVSQDGTDLGARVVDPNCPKCHGQGVVI